MVKSRQKINAGSVFVIELTQGKNVLVQGIIGKMATCLDWYYSGPYGRRGERVLRNVKVGGKKTKENLQRFLCGLKSFEKARVVTLDSNHIIIGGKEFINCLTNNLRIARKENKVLTLPPM